MEHAVSMFTEERRR